MRAVKSTLENLRGIATILCRPLASLPTEREVARIERFAEVSIKRPLMRYSELDWSLPNAELAALTKRSMKTLATYRRKYARETLDRFRAAKKVAWEKVDFAQSVEEICAATGCARRTVLAITAKNDQSLKNDPVRVRRKSLSNKASGE